MMNTVEAVIDESQDEALQAAESALRDDWLNEEEDHAWELLQKEA